MEDWWRCSRNEVDEMSVEDWLGSVSRPGITECVIGGWWKCSMNGKGTRDGAVSLPVSRPGITECGIWGWWRCSRNGIRTRDGAVSMSLSVEGWLGSASTLGPAVITVTLLLGETGSSRGCDGEYSSFTRLSSNSSPSLMLDAPENMGDGCLSMSESILLTDMLAVS